MTPSSGARLAAILLLALTSACAATTGARPRGAASLAEEARRAGFDADDPTALGPGVEAEILDAVGTDGDPRERLKTLVSYLTGGPHPFEYSPGGPRTAREAFRQRRGDCLAFAFLLTTLARKVDIPTYFVHVAEARSYYERGGSFFLSTHLAVGFGSGPSATILDFARITPDWTLALHQAIDDEAAAALYFNNVAVDWMMAGDAPRAERLLRFLMGRAPGIEELPSNLGAALLRQGRHREALAVLRQGLDAFPAYEPLYANALEAARRAGDRDAMRQLAEVGRERAEGDPFFLFGEGLSLYQDRRFALAAARFERASSEEPNSAVVFAWLARAYLSAGQVREGKEAFARVRRLAPEGPLARELEAQFPALAREARD